MKIDLVLFCDYALKDANSKTSLIGVFTELYGSKMKQGVSISAYLGIGMSDAKEGERFSLRMKHASDTNLSEILLASDVKVNAVKGTTLAIVPIKISLPKPEKVGAWGLQVKYDDDKWHDVSSTLLVS